MNAPPVNNQGYSGQLGLTDDKSDFNSMAFIIEQMLGLVRTCTLVKVVAVDGVGADSPVGFVDAQPLIMQMDGVGQTTAHGVVLNLPYFRLQGGTNAVVIDPQVGDIGLAVISDRDASAVKAGKAEGPPGSYRRFSLADGIYIGGILNGTPDQYVAFTEAGIKLADRNGNVIEMKAGGITITGNLNLTGNLNATGSVVGGLAVPANKVTLGLHIHAANNTPPTPGV